MAVNEFELIRTYFARQPVTRADVRLGIGDDAAVLAPPPGHELVVTTDLLVSGVHFLPDVDPAALGHKALAVNLSDLAAMGAQPAWFLLNLALPAPDESWLSGFSAGLFALARRYNMQLVGGDTSCAPQIVIAIEAHGFVPAGQALTRAGAKPGDRIFVTGALGDAGLALRHRQGQMKLSAAELPSCVERMDRPVPRVEEGLALRGIASSAIDISDGLVADLGHILEQSSAGAKLDLGRLPLSAAYRAHLAGVGLDVALANGDDYELCFTVPPANLAALEKIKQRFPEITAIGVIEAGAGLRIVDASGKPYTPKAAGHDHFG
ncbi:MAG: thiamine-phosphate kinase [Gammaproteobacteria bacterium]|nr:thiamine-phosphate kinase [Gammaproteobacteria bacterium]